MKLCFFVGLTQEQAAKELGISVSHGRAQVGIRPRLALSRDSEEPECPELDFPSLVRGIAGDGAGKGGATVGFRFKTLTQLKAIMKNARTTSRNIARNHLVADGLAMLIGAILALPGCVGMSEESALPRDDEPGIEVLSFSVSKLSRDSLGNANSPFSSFNMQEGEGGTVVLSRLTTRPTALLALYPKDAGSSASRTIWALIYLVPTKVGWETNSSPATGHWNY